MLVLFNWQRSVPECRRWGFQDQHRGYLETHFQGKSNGGLPAMAWYQDGEPLEWKKACLFAADRPLLFHYIKLSSEFESDLVLCSLFSMR